jgi:hypothetical protein
MKTYSTLIKQLDITRLYVAVIVFHDEKASVESPVFEFLSDAVRWLDAAKVQYCYGYTPRV